jgi:hypothetical protein
MPSLKSLMIRDDQGIQVSQNPNYFQDYSQDPYEEIPNFKL